MTLRENEPKSDFVENKKVKFYKFSLYDDAKVDNIEFTLTPIHGDPDLIVSRNYSFPNNTHFD